MKTLAVLVAVVLLLAALAMFAPATWLDGRLNGATRGTLRLADTSGTVWNGHGTVTNAQRSWSVPIGWTIDPRSFVRGEPMLTLRAAEGSDTPRGNVGWHDGAITMDGVAVTVPASLLNGSFAPGSVLTFGGQLAFDAPHASWSDKGGTGAAVLRWDDARLAGPAGTLALGTVTIDFAPRSGKFVGRVANRGGDARVDGEIALGNADIDVNLTVSPLPSTPPAVARTLASLGTPDATGAVRLQWRGGTR